MRIIKTERTYLRQLSLDVIALLFGLTVPAFAQSDRTGLSVITTKGYVSYTVGSDWKVLSMQTKPPKTAAVFQIANLADSGTLDSTNLSLMTFETDSSEAISTFAKLSKKLRSDAKPAKYRQWELFAQEGKQGSTNYSIRDACSKVPGAAVMIRLAWPHLKANSKDYDTRMEATFHSVLDSVSGGIGPKPKREGEVYRSPIDH